MKSDFSAGRVGAYCIRPTKRPARGEGVDDKRARGVFFCALPGYPSDNRLDMEKKDTYLSTIVRDNGKYLPEETLSFSGNVGAYCIRPTKRPAKGERIDVESIWGVCNTPLHGYLSDNRLDMKKRNTYLSTIVPNIPPRQPIKSDFSAGRVGAYCICPTKRPAKGVGVDDKRAGGVYNTPLPGYLSDNRLDMEKKDAYLSAIVQDDGKHQPKEPSSFSGNVGAYCIRPTKRPVRGERVDVKSIRGVCFCALHGYPSDNRLDMEK